MLELTETQTNLLKSILDAAIRAELNNAVRSPDAVKGVQKVQAVIDLRDLLMPPVTDDSDV
jgi:hypothetical protein